jgi:hypothetical protein
MISNGYLSKTAYGKKPLILSCDPATLGVEGPDNKVSATKNVIKLDSPPHSAAIRKVDVVCCGHAYLRHKEQPDLV